MSTKITVATYNVLADAHIRPDLHPLVDPADFAKETRYPRLVGRIRNLDADIICLQEADETLFAKLSAALAPLDYRGMRAAYTGKPDGVAIFLRWPMWYAFKCTILRFDDAAFNRGKPSGRAAQILRMRIDDKPLTIANCHLKWDDPASPVESRLGLAQARALIGAIAGDAGAKIVVGDFNAIPVGPVADAFRDAGFSDAHDASTMTFNAAHGGARKIDFLLHTDGLVAEPLPTPEVTDATPLPGGAEPSDHVPLVARIHFAD